MSDEASSVTTPSIEGRRMQAALELRLFGTPPPPLRVGRFVLVDVLGRGGMGIVYRAVDPDLDRVVAIKLLDARLGVSEARLLHEARALARLNHPHVVSVYEVGRAGAQLFLAMEHVEGVSLAQWCRRADLDARTRAQRALELFEQAARGLIAAHAAGIVHRDLKPGNILVGSDGRARLVDFGLARAATQAQDDAEIVGTPGYMAPEQALGVADERSDQFSLCVTFFQAIHGARPELGDTVATAPGPGAPGRATPRSRHLPAAVQAVLLRGLAADPAARFPSVAALLAALLAARRRRWRPLALVGAAAAAGLLAWALRGDAAVSACVSDEAALDPAWGAPRRAAVRAALTGSGAPFAASTWTRVEHGLDQIAARWRADDLAACRLARDPDPEVAAVGRARRACTQRATQTFAHATATLAELGPDVSRAIHVVDALADLVDCRAPSAASSDEALRLALLLDRAHMAERLHRTEEVVALANEVLAATRPGELPRLRAAAHGLLGGVHNDRAEHEQERAQVRARLGEAELADAPDEQAASWSALATHAARANDHDDAEFYLERARRFEREGRLSPRTRARLAWKQGLMQHWSGRSAAGIPDLDRAVQMLREATPGSLELAAALADQAEAHMFAGSPETALAAGEEAVALFARQLGPDHPEAALQRARAAVIHSFAQDEARTESELLAALAVLAVNPSYMPAVRAEFEHQLAQTRDNLGHFAAALQDIDRALALAVALVGPDSPTLAMPVTTRGRILFHLGEVDAARVQFDRALELARARTDHPDINIGELQLERAELLASQGHRVQAREALAEAQERLTRAYTPASDAGLQARGFIGRVLVKLGELDAARELLAGGVRDAQAARAGGWAGRLGLELARAQRAAGDHTGARATANAARAALIAAQAPAAALIDVDALLRELE